LAQEVHLVLDLADTSFDGPAVQALGGALGASLKRLTLQADVLDRGFWTAATTSLPGLQLLELRGDMAKPADVVSYCKRCGTESAVQVRLGDVLYTAAGAERVAS
jgi:hypothetical protein